MPLTATTSLLHPIYRHSSSTRIEITQKICTGSSPVNSWSRRNLSNDAGLPLRVSRGSRSVAVATGFRTLTPDPITSTIFGTILLAKTVGVLRNRSVEWLVNGYNAVNKPEVVKKVCTPSFHPQCTRTYESSDIRLGLGVVQSWRDQPLVVRMFDVS